MDKLRYILALISLFFLNLRGLGGSMFGAETLMITVLINFLLLIAIDYSRLNRHFFFIFVFLTPLLLYNRAALFLVDLALFVYLLQGYSIKKIALINFFTLILGYVTIRLFQEMGFLQMTVNTLYAHGKGVVHTFGFSNPNTFAFFYFNIVTNLYVVVKGFKIESFFTIILLLLSIVLYEQCQSRTMLGAIVVLFLMHWIIKYHVLGEKVKYIIGVFPTLFVGIIFFFIRDIDSYLAVDIFASGRLSIYSEIVKGMGKQNWLLGVSLPEGPMDGALFMLLFTGGIVTLFFFLWIFYKTLVFNYRSISVYLPVIVAVLFYGLFENAFAAVNGIAVVFWILICVSLKDNQLVDVSFKQNNRLNY